MAKILILAQSGFGKTTSIGPLPELGITGLDPKSTFIISATSKPLPFRGSNKIYKIVDPLEPPTEENGNRLISNNGFFIAKTITYLLSNRQGIKNIVIDDANYIMQDYYMSNALKKGYDVFKEIGSSMNAIFSVMESSYTVNFFMMAHYEEYKDSNEDTISYRFKTVGKMTQDFITPEGKFDVLLFGKQFYDEQNKKVIKNFVTNFDGRFPAKSPVGMFNELYIPNDLGYVEKAVKAYYE
jgi:hypothetical protein